MLADYALNNYGKIKPLMLPFEVTKGTGVMNPSIYNDNGTLLVNIRHVNYAIYHCHNFFQEYGPLQYIHEEHRPVLETTNFIASIDDGFNLSGYKKVNMLPSEAHWTFIGLEDARLVRWQGDLYLIGVRRDTENTGIGRMELTKLDSDYNEVSRVRIPAPGDNNSYCEKNWMPILNRPFQFVKWSLPTEVVSFHDGVTHSKIIDNYIKVRRDLRGGSQVVPYKDYYIAIVHEAALFQSELKQKDAVYLHRIICWDKDFNLVHLTEPFNFLGGKIEFCTGLAIKDDDAYISFGHQDNSAYLLKLPTESLGRYLWNNSIAI
jgi:hypothetical protein